MLDVFWDEVLSIFFLFEVQIMDEMCQQFIDGYKADCIYSKIMQDLKPYSIRENEDVFNVSKAGNPFQIAGGLLYNRDINRT